jgi:hypothetical protein
MGSTPLLDGTAVGDFSMYDVQDFHLFIRSFIRSCVCNHVTTVGLGCSKKICRVSEFVVFLHMIDLCNGFSYHWQHLSSARPWLSWACLLSTGFLCCVCLSVSNSEHFLCSENTLLTWYLSDTSLCTGCHSLFLFYKTLTFFRTFPSYWSFSCFGVGRFCWIWSHLVFLLLLYNYHVVWTGRADGMGGFVEILRDWKFMR